MNDSFKTKNIQQVTPLVVSQLNQGNVKAFDLIYHAYYVYLCAIAVYYVHDKNVAAELVNDVFVNLWNKKRDVSYPLLPYLRKSVQNSSISYMRSILYREDRQTVNDEHVWEYVEENILSSTDPLQALLNSELSNIIAEKVEKLPLQCKRIMKACLYEGKTYQEIAQELNIQVPTVRVQLKKARDSLREYLGTPIWVVLAIFL